MQKGRPHPHPKAFKHKKDVRTMHILFVSYGFCKHCGCPQTVCCPRFASTLTRRFTAVTGDVLGEHADTTPFFQTMRLRSYPFYSQAFEKGRGGKLLQKFSPAFLQPPTRFFPKYTVSMPSPRSFSMRLIKSKPKRSRIFMCA